MFANTVAGALLSQFEGHVHLKVEKSDVSLDPTYLKILAGLSRVAPSAGTPVLEQLLRWRGGALQNCAADRTYNGEGSLKARLIVEISFIEATIRVIGSCPQCVTSSHSVELERLAFDWILNADKYVASRQLELEKLKDRVILAASTLLGKLSCLSLDSITERFLAELASRIRADASSPARQELYDLCHSLRFLEVHGETPGQLKSSINFLERIFPLKHVANEKKSRVQHALCDILSSVLSQVVDQTDPGFFGAYCDASLRNQWFSTVTLLRTELLKWTVKQSKQALAGYPVVTVLTCLEEEGQLVNSIDHLIEYLHRQMKDKKMCSMALLCLARSVSCFLKRLSGRSDPDRLAKWVSRSTHPAVQAAVRGMLTSSEQLSLLRYLCSSVAITLPECALRGMVLEMMNFEAGQPWEASLVSIWSLMSILSRAPSKLNATTYGDYDRLPPTISALEAMATAMSGYTLPEAVSQEMQNLLAQEFCLFHVLGVGHLASMVSSSLERIRVQCHQLHGYSKLINSAKPATDVNARERVSALSVLVALLDCLPYAIPEGWKTDANSVSRAFIEDIPGYAMHAELSMRQAAIKALIRCMYAWPGSRNGILEGMSRLIVSLDEEYVDLAKEMSRLLLRLMSVWVDYIQKTPQDTWPSQSSKFETLDHVECCGVFLLCHEDIRVRNYGLDVLRLARQLDLLVGSQRILTPGSVMGSHSDISSTTISRSTVRAPDIPDANPLSPGSHARFPSQSLSPMPSGRLDSKGSHHRQTSSLGFFVPPLSFSRDSIGWQRTLSSSVAHGRQLSIPVSPVGIFDGNARKYLIDIILESGDIISRSCYWDFGPYSDILRIWKPIPDDVSFKSCMMESRKQDRNIRWSRILCEIIRESWSKNKRTAYSVFRKAMEKVQHLFVQENSGSRYLPFDTRKVYQCRMYAMLVSASHKEEAKHFNEISINRIETLIQALINSAKLGMDDAILVLGCIHETWQSTVVKLSSQLQNDYTSIGDKRVQSSRSMKGKRDDARLVHSLILKSIAANLGPSALAGEVGMRDELIEFIVNTARFIEIAADVSTELQQIRYSLCVVARQVALQLSVNSPQIFPPMLRKQLYNKFTHFSEEGQAPGLFQSELRRQVAAAKAAYKTKDGDQLRQVEAEIINASEILEYAASLAMAAMLLGTTFDADARDPKGRVFAWIDRILTRQDNLVRRDGAMSWAPRKQDIGLEALHLMLSSNLDLSGEFVDKCYSKIESIANSYFMVLSELYNTDGKLYLSPSTIMGLVLDKVVAAERSVRSQARKMLNTMEERANEQEFLIERAESDEVGSPSEEKVQGLVVVGNLRDSHLIYQQRISARLASEHSDIALDVTLEILSRHKQHAQEGASNDALLCLPPWLECANFAKQSTWGTLVLAALYDVSGIPGAVQSISVQNIWSTVASNRRNIIPALNFLIEKVVSESRASAARNILDRNCAEVGKHIALYLSRVAPRHTIDHLVHQAGLHMTGSSPEKDGESSSRNSNAVELGLIKEFHHKPSSAPAQQPLPQQQPLAAHAAAAIAAATADNSRPFTPSSLAQVIKRSTVDIIIKTSVAVADTVAVAGAAAVGTISASGLTSSDDLQYSSRSKYGEYELEKIKMQSRMTLDPLNAPITTTITDWTDDVPKVTNTRLSMVSSEAAICLLSEIVCENDEDLRPHLSQLLHISALNLDSCNPKVCSESCELLQYLLYNLSFKMLEVNSLSESKAVYSSDYARVAGVIGFLQEVNGNRVWEWELPTLSHPWISSAGSVAAFVQIVANCFPFDSGLRERWSTEALKWACCSSTRHAASRSHQVFCALSPSLTSQASTSLLFCLEKCLRVATTDGLDTAIEILCTLRVLLSNTSQQKLVLYPHLFAACIALLNSSVVRVGELAIAMLVQLLDSLDFSDPVIQQTLLSVFVAEDSIAQIQTSCPRWILGMSLLEGIEDIEEENSGPWMALQQLLVKGLFQGDTESLSLRALASLCRQISRASKLGGGNIKGHSMFDPQRSFFSVNQHAGGKYALGGIESILGDSEIGICLTIASSLPWVFVKLNSGEAEDISPFLYDLSNGCMAVGWINLAALLLCLKNDPNAKLMPDACHANWAKEVVPTLVDELFPKFSHLVIERFLETVIRAAKQYQKAALYILEALFQVPDLDLGDGTWVIDDAHLVDLLALEIDGDLGDDILRVLEAISLFKAKGQEKDANGKRVSWKYCIDEIGECNKVCSGALKRVVMSCPGTAQLLEDTESDLLPFLPES